MNHRPAYRIALRPANRDLARPAARVRWRTPNTLRLALACFRRAIQAHRRVARLAPAFFDSTVVELNRLRQKAEQRREQEVQPALAKVYGTPCVAPPRVSAPPLPPARVRVAVERELRWWRVWFGLGSQLLEEFRTRQPHAHVNLHSIALLLEIARDFGHLATGGNISQEEPDPQANLATDLARIYGDKQPRPCPTPAKPM